jgi:molybdenum cofactor cytidylyltransferase
MGRSKLLLPYRGRPLVCHAIECLAAAPLSPVCCVLGSGAEDILRELGSVPFSREIRFVVNPDHAGGRASSVRVGLRSLPDECAAAVFLPGDMPLVRPEDVGALVDRFRRTGAPVVVAVDESGARSHPVLFARRLFLRLLELEGDESGHALILAYWDAAEKVPVPGSRSLDIDTEEDYRRLLAEEKSGHAPLL